MQMVTFKHLAGAHWACGCFLLWSDSIDDHTRRTQTTVCTQRWTATQFELKVDYFYSQRFRFFDLPLVFSLERGDMKLQVI